MTSIIIPTLNEAACITHTLAGVAALPGNVEVVVVDGGSTDETCALAQDSARVMQSARGRAAQMNAGAQAASGEVLLFLHADTLLPPGALDAVQAALADPAVNAGCFRLGFDKPGWAYGFYSLCTRLPWHRMVFGDRAIFVRRQVFEAVGGFPVQAIFEDLDFFRRLHRQPGRLAYLPLAVTTSARRFEQHGPVRQQFRNVALWTLRNMGVSPHTLQRFYPYPEALHAG